MALNKKFFPKVADAAADVFTPSEHFNTVLYTGNGGTQRIGGYINRGAEFNGSANITTPLDFASLTDYTISIWLFVASAPSNTEFFAGTIQNSGALNGIYLAVETDGDIRFYERNASNTITILISTDSITFNSWNHIVAVRNGSTNYLYINNGTPVSASNSTITHATDFTIGRAGAYTTRPVVGKIDQVRIFDKGLSSSEVTTLYGETHSSTTISTTDIFSDNSGVALYQLDGNANDTGGASGKFGSAAIFTGTNASTGSKITVPNTVYGSNKSIFSISGWVKYSTTASETPIFGNGGTIGGTTGYAVYTYLGQIIVTFRTDPNQNFYNSGEYLDDNEWHHIALTFNNGAYALYIDGSESLSGTTTNYINNPTPTYDTHFGNRFGRNENGVLNGFMDDIRIYSDVLTSTEVGYIYNNTTASIPTDNLEAYYKLDGDARDEQQLYDGTASNVTYAYDGTASNVTYQEATNFTPDLVWVKKRDGVHDHKLADSVRGATKILESSTTDAEITATGSINAFHTNGFAVGSDSSVNGNGNDFVAWCFNAGDGSSASNTDGSITSTVKANQDAGFSIVKYTSDGSLGLEVGHGLSQQPEMLIYKKIDGATNWTVYTDAIDNSWDFLRLNTTAAKTDSSDTIANSSLIRNVSTAGDWIAYCFHSVDGYSKVGSYTGTGSSVNVETGFEPAWIIIKRTDSAEDWKIIDNKRDNFADSLEPNESIAEENNNNSNFVPTSNGFQMNDTSGDYNANGGTYIYLAIAADPDTTTPTVENSFDVVTYTGNGTDITVNTDFKPDMVWIKERTSTSAHRIVDSVRGDKKRIFTNTTDAESTVAAGEVFLENGFQIGADNGSNQNGEDYVAWVWKAGDHDDNLPQINTEGSIDSVVSVNAEAGFSIVSYTSNGANDTTVGHGLSAAPELIFFKKTSNNGDWFTYTQPTGANKYLFLNRTDAATGVTDIFKNINSTTFNLISGYNDYNASGEDYIAYCFHSVTGYQKIGSYTGTGSSGNSVTTGFRPRFVMVKKSSGTANWVIKDSQRDSTNPNSANLYPNLNNAENTVTTLNMDFDSNGFTLDGTSGDVNGSGQTYIYLAIK